MMQCLLEWLMAVPLDHWPSLGIRMEAVLGTLELALVTASRTQVPLCEWHRRLWPCPACAPRH